MILGALTVLFFFHGESARLQDGRLVHVPRLGPFSIILDYDLARVRNVRLQNTGSRDAVRIRFDHARASHGLGDIMPRPDAERLVGTILSAAAATWRLPKTG